MRAELLALAAVSPPAREHTAEVCYTRTIMATAGTERLERAADGARYFMRPRCRPGML